MKNIIVWNEIYYWLRFVFFSYISPAFLLLCRQFQYVYTLFFCVCCGAPIGQQVPFDDFLFLCCALIRPETLRREKLPNRKTVMECGARCRVRLVVGLVAAAAAAGSEINEKQSWLMAYIYMASQFRIVYRSHRKTLKTEFRAEKIEITFFFFIFLLFCPQ